MTTSHAASFRDPNGFIFTREGVLYRQVNQAYASNYSALMATGLYDQLVGAGLLIPHREVELDAPFPETAWKVIQPEPLPFISYPYEWSFSQLKDAALLTLRLQKMALEKDLWLKDASAYNIQFHRGRPVLIDTLSFETCPEGRPWVAYRQFCQHFLAPLALMAHLDVRLGQLLRIHIDGLPLDLAARLLPWQTRFNIPLLLHIHAHAASQKRYAGQTVSPAASMSRIAILGLVDSLEGAIRALRWSPAGTTWSSYYGEEHNYTLEGLEHKQALVDEYLQIASPASLWDLGANTGRFSRVAAGRGIPTLAFDIDPGAVELNYQEQKRQDETNLLPLLLDLTNPTPAAGWHNRERMSLLERGPASAVMALALVHHLAIANNTPLDRIASFFQDCGEWLIVEFVPKSDSQVQRMLASRLDIFPDYTREGFEAAFGRYYTIQRRDQVTASERSLYLMRKI